MFRFPIHLLLLLLCCGGLIRTTSAQPPAPTAGRPNLILLLADDLRWDALGCAGNREVRTPHLDRLARDGTWFRNAFVTDAICAPSRASILSGQYIRRHGIDDFAKTFTQQQWASTYPAQLRAAGYRTGFIGKFGVGNLMPTNAFDFWRGFPGQGNYWATPRHLTARMGDQALEFLADTTPSQPFCLSISYKAPHTQDENPTNAYPVDPIDLDLYADRNLTPPPTHGSRFFDALPESLKQTEGRLRWLRRGYNTPEIYQRDLHNYHRLVAGIDRTVGRIRDSLRTLGLDKNTIILFTSDNGFFLGGRGLVDKFFMYEESIRVPMIIMDPRSSPRPRPRGARLDPMVLNIDIAPTLLDYAGLTPGPEMQGRSLRPLVEGRSIPWRDDFFYEHHFRYTGTIPASEGVRTTRWKYVVYLETKPPLEQLFDLRRDPLELVNLATDPRHARTLHQLRDRHQELAHTLKGASAPASRP